MQIVLVKKSLDSLSELYPAASINENLLQF
jgi:hypothetical protein